MKIKLAIENYMNEIAKHGKDSREIIHRTAFENLINNVQLPKLKITITQESRVQDDITKQTNSTPDFFVYKNDHTHFVSLVGLIECKKPSFAIEDLISSNQISKYNEVCPNIIVTNYREFILLNNGRKVGDKIILLDSNMEIQNGEIEKFINLLYAFYQYEYEQIRTKNQLAKHLARVSFYYAKSLREFFLEENNKNHHYFDKLLKLFTEYRDSMHYEFDKVEFCDIYAQSLAYGLCIARIDTRLKFKEDTICYLEYIPDEYSILIEFLSKAWVIKSSYLPTSILLSLRMTVQQLNQIDSSLIEQEILKADFDNNSIATYLYEEFLKEYDILRETEKRKENGVYYTPKEATNFIVRSVNYLIKSMLNMQEGYLHSDVKLLDFACGTGTFLNSVIDEIIPMQNNLDDIQKTQIKNKILADFYGFELLFTPYIVAHTILRKKLANLGVHLDANENLGIYLTNTLVIENTDKTKDLFDELKKEHEKALSIKNNNVLAIIGNPPYRIGKTKILSKEINKLLLDYKVGLNEQKDKLNDIYIKFIRFAQWKIDKQKQGIFGIIVNNSFLNGHSHKIMRKKLIESFSDIYILNLHGNASEVGKNIFDIRVGVCIVFFIKRENKIEKSINYFSSSQNEIYTRDEKLHFLNNNNFSDINWTKLNPIEENGFLFLPSAFDEHQNGEKIAQYKKFYTLRKEVFINFGPGISTNNDNATIFYSKESLNDFYEKIRMGNPEIKDIFKSKDNWDAEKALLDLRTNYNPVKILYRPFDFRWTSLSKMSGGFINRPNYKIFNNMKNNMGLAFSRNGDSNNYLKAMVTSVPVDLHFIGDTSFCPLNVELPNGNSNFTDAIKQIFTYEQHDNIIFAYIYGVISSPQYWSNFGKLINKYPAIPITRDELVFRKFAKLGQNLIDCHLLKPEALQDNKVSCNFNPIDKKFEISKIHEPKGINEILTLDYGQGKTIVFKGISESIYNFKIGGYRPIDKWLKYRIRDNHTLVLDDLVHIKNMAIAIAKTIEILNLLNDYNQEFLSGL